MTQDPAQASEFVDGLLEAVKEDVQVNLKTISDEDCVQFVREFVSCIQAFRGDEDDSQSILLAARSLYFADLFSHAFKRAYIYTNKYITASQALEKVFSNDSNDS